MKTKFVLFLFSVLNLIYFLNATYALGLAADEFVTSPSILLGGNWILALHWILLGLSFVLATGTVFSMLSHKISKSNHQELEKEPTHFV